MDRVPEKLYNKNQVIGKNRDLRNLVQCGNNHRLASGMSGLHREVIHVSTAGGPLAQPGDA